MQTGFYANRRLLTKFIMNAFAYQSSTNRSINTPNTIRLTYFNGYRLRITSHENRDATLLFKNLKNNNWLCYLSKKLNDIAISYSEFFFPNKIYSLSSLKGTNGDELENFYNDIKLEEPIQYHEFFSYQMLKPDEAQKIKSRDKVFWDDFAKNLVFTDFPSFGEDDRLFVELLYTRFSMLYKKNGKTLDPTVKIDFD